MQDVWRLPAIAPWEKVHGKHPTQKPLSVLARCILASTEPGAWILDPFCGSATSGVAAVLLKRKFLGLDIQDKYLEIGKARHNDILDSRYAASIIKKLAPHLG